MDSDKPRNGGEWTEARYRQFVQGAFRAAHKRWGPRNAALKRARVERGKYQCEMCGTVGPKTLPPLEGRKRRRNNAAIDHIEPVVDPKVGFVDWNTFEYRMFREVDGYQILCWECHAKVTKQEIDERTKRMRKEKECQK